MASLRCLGIIGQRSHLRLWKIAIYNPIKKPAKIICESHPELCNAASRDFQAVLAKIGQKPTVEVIQEQSVISKLQTFKKILKSKSKVRIHFKHIYGPVLGIHVINIVQVSLIISFTIRSA
jgi:hypothetical protein